MPEFDYAGLDDVLPVERGAILGILAQVAKLERSLNLLRQMNAKLRFEFVEFAL